MGPMTFRPRLSDLLLIALPNRQNHSVRESRRKKRPVEWALVWAILYFCAPLGQLGTDLAHDLHHRLSHESADHVHVHPTSFPSHTPASHDSVQHAASDALHPSVADAPHTSTSRASEEHDHSGAHGHGTTIDLLLVLFEHVGTAPGSIPDRESNRHWEHVLPSTMDEPLFGWSGAFAGKSVPLTPPTAESIEHPPTSRV